MSRAWRAGSRLGMTLLEIIIVLVVLSIVMTIAMWKIDIARYQINGDQQVLGTALIAAQRQAIAKQHNIIVLFDNTRRTMRVISDSNNNGKLDAGEHVITVQLSDRVRFGLGTAAPMTWGSTPISFTITEGASGLPAVIFYRNGSASESRGVYLCSTRAMTDATYVRDVRALHVERATGRVEWFHYDGANWVRGF
jgi:prepilin-type N-terminal cleavage/methylation domain-containing protein